MCPMKRQNITRFTFTTALLAVFTVELFLPVMSEPGGLGKRGPTAPKRVGSRCALCKSTCWISSTKFHKLSKPKGWEIEIAYPQFKGEPAENMQRLNLAIKNLVNNENKKIQNKGTRIDPLEIPYWFRSDYESLLANPHLVSIVFHFNQFYGGAHGDNWSVPFNFQIVPDAKVLSLDAFFGKKADLIILSNLCRIELYKKLGGGDSFIVIAGTNFSNPKTPPRFAFDKSGMVFYFDPYEVASYAEGPQELRLSYGRLRSLFSPKSPVYNYVRDSTEKALELDSDRIKAEAEAAAVRFDAQGSESQSP